MSLLAYLPEKCPMDDSNAYDLLNTHRLFQQYFEILEANSPQLIDQALALRYQVYCTENSYEDATCFPEEREQDCYDKRSVHLLIRHRGSREPVATARLVLPDHSGIQALYPLEACCGPSFDSIAPKISFIPRHSLAEISRFAISKEARQRMTSLLTIMGTSHIHGFDHNHAYWSRLLYSHLTLVLLGAAMRLSWNRGITHWYALMTPVFLRALRRFGFQITSIGPWIEHRGKRQPCMDELKTLLTRIYEERPEVWKVLTDNGAIWPESAGSIQEKQEKTFAAISLGKLGFPHSKHKLAVEAIC